MLYTTHKYTGFVIIIIRVLLISSVDLFINADRTNRVLYHLCRTGAILLDACVVIGWSPRKTNYKKKKTHVIVGITCGFTNTTNILAREIQDAYVIYNYYYVNESIALLLMSVLHNVCWML